MPYIQPYQQKWMVVPKVKTQTIVRINSTLLSHFLVIQGRTTFSWSTTNLSDTNVSGNSS